MLEQWQGYLEHGGDNFFMVQGGIHFGVEIAQAVHKPPTQKHSFVYFCVCVLLAACTALSPQ